VDSPSRTAQIVLAATAFRRNIVVPFVQARPIGAGLLSLDQDRDPDCAGSGAAKYRTEQQSRVRGF
jgi:hypothetical protein